MVTVRHFEAATGPRIRDSIALAHASGSVVILSIRDQSIYFRPEYFMPGAAVVTV
jgi:hypothetical protein